MKKMLLILLPLLLALLPFAALASAEEKPVQLPAYTYPGEDPLEAAVANYTAGLGLDAYHEDGDVNIPAPVILKIEMTDENHARVYGNFWHFYYRLNATVLESISGGEEPGIMELEKTENGWVVTNFTVAEDGEGFADSLSQFANGDEELENQYFESSDLLTGKAKEVREKYLADYVKANVLPVDSYQDVGWDAIPLSAE